MNESMGDQRPKPVETEQKYRLEQQDKVVLDGKVGAKALVNAVMKKMTLMIINRVMISPNFK